MPVVILRHCDEYRPELIDPIVRESLALRKFVRGDRVLVKANMLAARSPEKCVTTHPALVESVCRALLDLGCRPFIGDSPGIEPFTLVARVSGIAAVGEKLGVPVRELSRSTLCPPSSRRVNKRLELSADALEADAIVSLPKLKTHCQMQLTMAVKNLFGTVAGTRKAQWHYAVGLDRARFASVLIDILVSLPPVLSIVDGVHGMEGRGPGSGTPRFFGLIAASDDAVALDAALAPMMGLPPEKYAPLAAARERGVGDAELARVEWRGDLDPRTRFEYVDLPRLDSLSLLPSFMDKLGRALLASRPEQDENRCVQCGRCAEICPAGALVLERKKLRFDYSRCIRCYCCHEMCPRDAIRFRESAVMKLLHVFSR
ncbi:MAG: DUF362 domain-containing protein [Pyramidobacter sp.]|nr:DUF362 domain-containing protein [Pyramidobacter sp.]